MFLKLCRQSGGQSLMHTRVVGGHGRVALPTTVDGLHLPAPKYNNIQKSRMLSMNAVCRPPPQQQGTHVGQVGQAGAAGRV